MASGGLAADVCRPVLRGLQTATAAMAVTTRDVQPIRKGQVVTAEVGKTHHPLCPVPSTRFLPVSDRTSTNQLPQACRFSVIIYLYQASARVDLAGGWSDTPPISYEMGGEVLNLAIRIHGRKPMGAKVSHGHEGVRLD